MQKPTRGRPQRSQPQFKRKPKPKLPPQQPRPASGRLIRAGGTTTRLNLPHGCFNAGLVAIPETDQFLCVYRPNEHAFRACVLDNELRTTAPDADLGLTNCADPRLVWLPDGRLLLVYSSIDDGKFKNECIRGAILYDPAISESLIHPLQPFRISAPGMTRQKNWVPFIHDDRIYLVAETKPHTIYELPAIGSLAAKVHQTDWLSPWFSTEFLRGNTPPVRLDDGNFLGTFHSVQVSGRMHHYDNGCYVFEGKPPFRIIRAAHRTWLPAEGASEPHFRKAGQIQVCFPVGMVRNGEKLLISYGDNDSSVKILQTTVSEMLATTLPVY